MSDAEIEDELPPPLPRRRSPHRTPAAQKRLRRRLLAERGFRALGQAAILTGLGFVVLLFALVQWVSPQGSGLVALLLVFGAGVAPLAVVLYVMGAPARRRRRAKG